MTITEALSGVQTLFLDTAPVIYYVEGHPDYLPIVETFFERIDEGLLTAVTSPITLSECLVLPYRLNAEWLAEHFSGHRGFAPVWYVLPLRGWASAPRGNQPALLVP